MNAIYRDRREAGRILGDRIAASYGGEPDLIVLGLPRGGVPVAYEVAARLQAPLDVFVVRKLGVPGQEELAMGAIAAGGVRVLDWNVIDTLGIPLGTVEDVARREAEKLVRRERQYRGDRPAPRMTGRSVLLIDDGLATGSSMRAAIDALSAYSPAKIIVGVPVAPPDGCEMLRRTVRDVVCAATPEPFDAVGRFYDDFSPVTDREVQKLLAQAAEAEAENPNPFAPL